MNPFSSKGYLFMLAQVKTVLVKMLEKIQKAKNYGTASKESIDENEAMLSKIYSFVEYVENIPLSGTASLKEIRDESFQRGWKAKENSILKDEPNKFYDKEAFRARHEMLVRLREPHLF